MTDTLGPLARPDQRRKNENPKDLSAYDWWLKVGTAEAMRVCELAGTTFPHFKHIAHGRRGCSVDMATRLYKASNGGMSFAKLLNFDPSILKKGVSA